MRVFIIGHLLIRKNIQSCFNCAEKRIYDFCLFGLVFFSPRLVLTDIAVTVCSVVNFRIPVPVSGPGQFEMRRQSSELFLDGALSPPCQRMGAMVAFQCFDDFKRSQSRHWYFLLLLWMTKTSRSKLPGACWWASFAGILTRSSPALRNHCWRVRPPTRVLVSMIRRTLRSALSFCQSFSQLCDVTSISEASQLSAINRTKGRTQSTSLTCP